MHRGTFGTVRKAIKKEDEDGEEYAVKILEKYTSRN